MNRRDYSPPSHKYRPNCSAAKREAVSSAVCLDCGHTITDHHRAGGGFHADAERQRGERSHCIGRGDTCPCRKFVQPHTFTRKSVMVDGMRA